MTPSIIPAGSLCVLDTNVLLYAEQGVSPESIELLRRCAAGEISVVLPEPVWPEVTHKLVLAEAMASGKISGNNPARRLAEQPDVARQLHLYRTKVHALTEMGVRFESSSMFDLLHTAFEFQKRYGLLTNDAVILAVAQRIAANFLVTYDAALLRTREVPVVMPGPQPV